MFEISNTLEVFCLEDAVDATITKLEFDYIATFNYIWRKIEIKLLNKAMCKFIRNTAKSMQKKTEIELSIPAHTIGLSYSLPSCSSALLNSALLNEANIRNLNSTV